MTVVYMFHGRGKAYSEGQTIDNHITIVYKCFKMDLN